MRDRAGQFLKQALEAPRAEFRDGQWECIEALLNRRRMLVVQRTGWGKSMVYFLATRMLRDQGAGVSLLISPLLALMRNQILAAGRIGVRAASINSSNREDWEDVQEQLEAGVVDILLISPERLANDDFRENILGPSLFPISQPGWHTGLAFPLSHALKRSKTIGRRRKCRTALCRPSTWTAFSRSMNPKCRKALLS